MGKKATILISDISSGEYDHIFKNLYVDDDIIPAEKSRFIQALESFISIYGDLEAEIYSAPGRSEISGNHTDHQRGKVLATSVNIDAIAVCSPSSDNFVHFKSEGYTTISVDITNPSIDENLFGTTEALINGVSAGFKTRGLNTKGFKTYVTSQVLPGSGLSSSAAIEILIGQIFSGLFNDSSLDPVTLAIIGQEAENRFFGKPSGLMDQMGCSVGGLIHIDFKDALNPLITKVDVDFESFNHSLCVVDTKCSHADLTDDYATITEEMRSVSNFFNKDYLSQVSEDEFYKELPNLRNEVNDRAILRSIHFFDDIHIVDKEVEALTKSDFTLFKCLIKESGNSSFKHLQNLYSPKRPTNQNIPLCLALTDKILGKDAACRIQGGGFAGTILVFVPNESVSQYKKEIEKVYGKGACHVLKIRNIGGCKVL